MFLRFNDLHVVQDDNCKDDKNREVYVEGWKQGSKLVSYVQYPL